jgi:DNA-binding NarL/FixJ family response regulator
MSAVRPSRPPASVDAPAATDPSSQRSPTLFIVEDHAALRRGVELLMRSEGVRVVGTAGDAAAAAELIPRRRPDVVLADIGLPGESGVELARRLREDPELGILLYTGLDDAGALREALDCGARGFALKAGDPGELIAAISLVAAGQGYVDPRLEPLLFARSTTEEIRILSVREREVLALLADGMSGEEVAKRLFLSPETVRTHIRNTMAKLEADTRVHAIAIALRRGEISL